MITEPSCIPIRIYLSNVNTLRSDERKIGKEEVQKFASLLENRQSWWIRGSF